MLVARQMLTLPAASASVLQMRARACISVLAMVLALHEQAHLYY